MKNINIENLMLFITIVLAIAFVCSILRRFFKIPPVKGFFTKLNIKLVFHKYVRGSLEYINKNRVILLYPFLLYLPNIFYWIGQKIKILSRFPANYKFDLSTWKYYIVDSIKDGAVSFGSSPLFAGTLYFLPLLFCLFFLRRLRYYQLNDDDPEIRRDASFTINILLFNLFGGIIYIFAMYFLMMFKILNPDFIKDFSENLYMVSYISAGIFPFNMIYYPANIAVFASVLILIKHVVTMRRLIIGDIVRQTVKNIKTVGIIYVFIAILHILYNPISIINSYRILFNLGYADFPKWWSAFGIVRDIITVADTLVLLILYIAVLTGTKPLGSIQALKNIIRNKWNDFLSLLIIIIAIRAPVNFIFQITKPLWDKRLVPYLVVYPLNHIISYLLRLVFFISIIRLLKDSLPDTADEPPYPYIINTLARESETGLFECPECGADVNESDIICPECGTEFEDDGDADNTGMHAIECGAEEHADGSSNPKSGAELDEENEESEVNIAGKEIIKGKIDEYIEQSKMANIHVSNEKENDKIKDIVKKAKLFSRQMNKKKKK